LNLTYCPTLSIWVELKYADGTICDAASPGCAIHDDNERIQKRHVQHSKEKVHNNSQRRNNNALNWFLSLKSHEGIQEPQAEDKYSDYANVINYAKSCIGIVPINV